MKEKLKKNKKTKYWWKSYLRQIQIKWLFEIWNISIEIQVVEDPSGHGHNPTSPLGAKRKKKLIKNQNTFYHFLSDQIGLKNLKHLYKPKPKKFN